MVLCFFALPIFAVLAIFSARYRKLAWEAFQCVFLKLTFRPCHVGLDTKIKSAIVGGIFKRHKGLGRFTYKHFTILSWVFVILLLGSTYYTVDGGVNYYLYGNCNGPQSDSFCLFDPTGANSAVSGLETGSCGIVPPIPESLTLEKFNRSMHPQIVRAEAEHDVVIIGCYGCKFTRKTYPDISELISHPNVNVTFAHLPLHGDRRVASLWGECVRSVDEDLFWEFSDAIFNLPIEEAHNVTQYREVVSDLGLNAQEVEQCALSNSTVSIVDKQIENIMTTNVYGTPTIFIDGEPIVGPKPSRVYRRLID